MEYLKYRNVNIILFYKDISQETINKNAENLNIAQLNLSDFNERMGTNYDLICCIFAKLLIESDALFRLL